MKCVCTSRHLKVMSSDPHYAIKWSVVRVEGGLLVKKNNDLCFQEINSFGWYIDTTKNS